MNPVENQHMAAYYSTPLGKVRFSYQIEGITSLKRLSDAEWEAEKALHKPSDLSDWAYNELIEYFEGKRKVFTFPIKPIGTPFQCQVWEALRRIPYGETRNYKQIAEKVGNPKASRAVGMANNKNPLWIVVPCHRVVGANGSLVGYAGGLDMKAWLLTLEKENAQILTGGKQ